MNGIFLSYRREDTSGFARGLFQSLVAHFGPDQVFMDVEGIELGVDFTKSLEQRISHCGVLLVLIGKNWATCTDEKGNKRLSNPSDWVRLEVATALKRDIRVIPVLVRNAHMPKPEDLPDDLKSITRRQALEIRHNRWDADVNALIEALSKISGIGQRKKKTAAAEQHRPENKAVQKKASTSVPVKSVKYITKFLAFLGVLFTIIIVIGVIYSYIKPYSPDAPPFEPFPPPDVKEQALVLEVQELLSELGYQPGPINGKIGDPTILAVRAFQRTINHEQNGQITEQLIKQLNAALVSPTPSPAPNNPSPELDINMTGTWNDQERIIYNITQQDLAIQFEAFDALGNFLGGGEGRIVGREVQYVMVGQEGSLAGHGTLSQDGHRMDFTVTNLDTGIPMTGWIQKNKAYR